MLNILYQIASYHWKHISSFDAYNAQIIIERVQISNVTSRNSVESYVCWKFNVSDTSLEGTQAY